MILEVDQINSPRNINVALTSEGWLVTWDPPDNGAEYVDHYTVRWSQGKLPAGSADTTNTFFLGKFYYLSPSNANTKPSKKISFDFS